MERESIKVALTMVHIILDVFLGERIKMDDLGFFIVKCLLLMTFQDFNGMQCFLKAGVKGLGGHVYSFFCHTHVMEKAVASGNRASGGGNIIEKGVENFVESVGLSCSIVIFNIFGFVHHMTPTSLGVSILQNLVVIGVN